MERERRTVAKVRTHTRELHMDRWEESGHGREARKDITALARGDILERGQRREQHWQGEICRIEDKGHTRERRKRMEMDRWEGTGHGRETTRNRTALARADMLERGQRTYMIEDKLTDGKGHDMEEGTTRNRTALTRAVM